MDSSKNIIDTSNTANNNGKRTQVGYNMRQCCYKDLLPAKGCYLFEYMISGSFLPYVYLFLVSMGLTITQAGLINGIRTLMAAVISFFVGILVDRTGKKKLMFFVLLTLNYVSLISTPFVLYPFYNVSQNKNDSQSQIISSSPRHANTTQIPLPISMNNPQLFYFTLFWLTILAITGFPLLSLIDSSVINLVKSFNGRASYGVQRLFAPIGYTIGALLSGVAVDAYIPSYGLNKYTIVYLLLIPMCLSFSMCVYFLNTKPQIEYISIQTEAKPSLLKSLYMSCKNISFVIFLLTVLVSGLSFNIINSYLLLLMEEMNISKSAMGFIVALSSVAEIVMFPITTKLMRLLRGTYVCFAIGIFSYAFRFFIYYVCNSLWHVLVAQLLHSFGFALFWAAAIEHTYEIAPSNISQSMFSAVNMVYYMISSFIANVIGSAVYDVIGGRNLFLSMSSLCCFWGIILLAFYIMVERHKIKPATRETNETICIK